MPGLAVNDQYDGGPKFTCITQPYNEFQTKINGDDVVLRRILGWPHSSA